jgi:hypothetical protein
MLKFDKIKLTTDINYINYIVRSYFIENKKNESVISLNYINTNPYDLLIKVDYIRQELVLEFTSKILLTNLTQLISIYNIKEVLNQINLLGIINFDLDKVLNNSKVLKCDVTKDIDEKLDTKIYKQLKLSICNFNKWETTSYKSGIKIKKKVKTRKCFEELSIYDKYVEISEKKLFLKSFNNSTKNKILDYYNNVTRFEIKLSTIASIKEKLEITDNNLLAVLNSKANPIENLFIKIFQYNLIKNNKITLNNKLKIKYMDLFDFTQKEELFNYLLLEKCNYDIKKIEPVLVHICSSKTDIRKILKTRYYPIILGGSMKQSEKERVIPKLYSYLLIPN